MIARLAIVLALASMGCDEFVPDVVTIRRPLNDGKLRTVLEAAVHKRACPEVEAHGYECEIPERLASIKVVWVPDGSAYFELRYCIKGACE